MNAAARAPLEELATPLADAREPALARWSRPSTRIVRIASLVITLAAWEILGREANPILMSYPSAIAIALVDLLGSGKLVEALVVSGQSFVLGYLIAAAVGIPLGLLMGRYRYVEATLDLYVNALYATPLIALIPLFVLWFGLGFTVKVAVVAIMTVFPILISTWTGVQNASRQLIELGRAFCADERMIVTKIIVPATIPYIVTGLRLGIGRAVIGMVMAEFFTSISGLGGIIINSANNFQTARMFVPIVVLMVLAIGLSALLRIAERRFAPWLELLR